MGLSVFGILVLELYQMYGAYLFHPNKVFILCPYLETL